MMPQVCNKCIHFSQLVCSLGKQNYGAIAIFVAKKVTNCTKLHSKQWNCSKNWPYSQTWQVIDIFQDLNLKFPCLIFWAILDDVYIEVFYTCKHLAKYFDKFLISTVFAFVPYEFLLAGLHNWGFFRGGVFKHPRPLPDGPGTQACWSIECRSCLKCLDW